MYPARARRLAQPLPRRAALSAAAALAVVCVAGPARARTSHDSPYSYAQTFGTALRLVKVDLELPVTETNPEWGYFLFEYTSAESGQRKTRGAFELIQRDDFVVVSVQLPSMPSYHERMIVEKLQKKLEAEHGAPPKRAPDKAPREPRQPPDEPEPAKPPRDQDDEGDHLDPRSRRERREDERKPR